MENRVKLFSLMTQIERDHEFILLDGETRIIFEFIAQRQVEQVPNDAASIIAHLSIPRPTIYRKLTLLKERRFIKEKWIDRKMNYELDKLALDFLGDLLVKTRSHLTNRN